MGRSVLLLTGFGFLVASTAHAALDAPTQATATAVSSSQIRLNWRDNAVGEAGYKISFAVVGTTEWSDVITVPTPNLATYTVSGLRAATAYRFRVRAYVRGQSSKPAQPLPEATTLPATPPSPSPSPSPSSSPSPEPVACTGVRINFGENWQDKVNANTAGTTFCIAAGTHVGQQVVPKAGNRFIGDAGAVMDGALTAGRAFRAPGGDPDNVLIKNLRITRYNPGYAGSVIEVGASYSDNPADYPTGWVIEDVEVSYSETGTGVFLGNNAICRRCNIHHNDVQNIVAKGRNSLLEDSELAFGNYRRRNEWGHTGGGSKFVLTDGLVVRRTYVHDNHGPGLWTDIDNIRTVYEDNRVEDNEGPGIYHEISYSASIRGNQIRRNGGGFCTWVWGAGIQISAAGGTNGELIEIYNNHLEDNCRGIFGVQQNRGSGLYGPHHLQNMWVHDNTVIQNIRELGGVAQDIGDPSIHNRNLRWDRNTYQVGAGVSRPFGWMDAARTWSEWRNFGQDLNSSLTNF